MSTSTRPPDPRATLRDTDESPLDRALRIALEGRETGRLHTDTLTEHGDRLDALEQLVGRAPSALPGDRGSGLAQHLVDLTLAVTGLRESVEADRKARGEDAAKLAAARAPWSRVGWTALGALIAVVVSGAGTWAMHWLSTLHH